VVHDREVGITSAEALDGLVRLELDDLDDELWMRAAQTAHGSRDEGRQGAGEGRETQPRGAAAEVLHGGLGAGERGEDALDVGAQECAGASRAKGALGPVDERRPDLALQGRELL